MTDHLQDAVDKVSNARGELLGRVARIRDVNRLIMAVRHQVAEEIRDQIMTRKPLTRIEGQVLSDVSAIVDPYRLDPVTRKWVIR